MGAASLWLRPLTVDDADVMSSVLSDPSLYEFNGGEPATRAELTRRYAVQTRGHSPDASQRWVNLVVVLGVVSQPAANQPIGYVQATIPVNGDATEVAWVIGTPWQGHGYATRAARLLLADLAQQGIGSVVAHIHPSHTASRRIATHLGMAPTTIIVEGETRWAGSTADLSSKSPGLSQGERQDSVGPRQPQGTRRDRHGPA